MTALILAYHRIANEQWDPFELCVPPPLFEEHLRVMETVAPIVPVSEVTASNAPVIALSFDDGYLDNSEVAAPLLTESRTYATFFICSRNLIGPRPFWWDALAFISENAPKGHRPIRWEARRIILADDRHQTLAGLHADLMALPASEVEALVEDFAAQLGLNLPPDRLPQLMGAPEVQAIAASPLFEVGSHTCSHPLLTSQPRASQEYEILESLTSIERALGVSPTAISYPFGAHDEVTIQLVQQAGYERGYTVGVEQVSAIHDGYRTPRVLVPALQPDAFKSWLTALLV